MSELFQHPEWLGSLLAIGISAVVAVLVSRAIARRRRARLLGTTGAAARRASDAALLVALIAIGLALAGPRVGEREVRVPSGGVDVVFLMDVSRSMDVRDVPPSRLDRARETAAALLARLEPQDRAALAIFAGRGVLLTPLTPDRSALAEMIAALDTELIHPASSDLGAGLRASLDAFVAGSDRPRIVFVLADGEDPQGARDLSIGELLRAQVRVVGAAFGTEVGGTIPDHGAPLRDASGSVAISRRRTARLEELAEATGGEAFRADEWGQVDLERAAAALRRDAGSATGETVVRRVRAVRVAPLAALAFVLLLAEGLPRRAWRARYAGAAAAALFVLGAGPGPATPDPRTLIEVGLAHMQNGELDAAARAFTAAAIGARDPALASLAYYDLGVNALERGDLPGARDAFFDALAVAPDDRRTRFNLEWALRALASEPPPAGPRSDAEPPERSRSEPPERSEPEPSRTEPEDDATPGERAATVPEPERPPSAEQRQRWLERAEDDPARSMRLFAREEGRRRPAGPVW